MHQSLLLVLLLLLGVLLLEFNLQALTLQGTLERGSKVGACQAHLSAGFVPAHRVQPPTKYCAH